MEISQKIKVVEGKPVYTEEQETAIKEFFSLIGTGQAVIHFHSKVSVSKIRCFFGWARIIADFTGEDLTQTQNDLICLHIGEIEPGVPVSLSLIKDEDLSNGLTKINRWAKEFLDINLPSSH